jgi:GWxTD domain-containing protein
LTCSVIRRSVASVLLLGLTLGAALGVAGCGGATGGGKRPTRASLTNPFLGPDYSSWLVGPVARLATPEETEAYLALTDDAQAEAFIQRFWASRDPAPDRPGNPVLEAFEQRAAEADRAYSEAGQLGRYTHRGAIYILYGEPERVTFETAPDLGSPNLEVWVYGAGAPSGLDARRPANLYRFIKRGNVTVLYTPGVTDPRLRQPAILDDGR